MPQNKETVSQREIILEALIRIHEEGAFSHVVIAALMEKYAFLPDEQRFFIRYVISETVRNRIYLDYMIDALSKTKVAKMKPLIRNLLRMSACQILLMEQIPASAAVNEAVKLAKKRGFSSLSGFVNGVLRNLDRKKDSILLPDPEKDRMAYYSVKYSLPVFVVEKILSSLPEEEKEQADIVLAALHEKRPLCMRLSYSLSEEEKQRCLKELEEADIRATGSEMLAYAYYLEGVSGIENLPGFKRGNFYLQDIGSMMVVCQADLKKGDKVLDLCGAPGGKALQAADRLNALGGGSVEVRDVSEAKVEKIRENIRKSGLTNIEARVFDATKKDDTRIGQADVVIADVPCSGLGVLGRKPDIALRLKPEDFLSLQALQRRILSASFDYVKPGGTLLYSTCTVTREENEDNREWILQNLPFSLEKELRLSPGITESDGFYMAVFKRNEQEA
ncbi:MAG: 16S rRNA (cytosine(967)-C(5))-methyltransferase RsmB [Lachnospiraceae bacterium]|nr:16S rRNA (cytosine(967)-C(5))-methyltransferase RsmB [Lachnospiraceae bacterium]